MHPAVSDLQYGRTVIRQGSSIIVSSITVTEKDASGKVTLIRLVVCFFFFGGGGLFTDAPAFTDGVRVKVSALVLSLCARSTAQLAPCSVSF